LDIWFKSYEVFKISAQVGACCQPMLMQHNLPKTVQSCENLPKDETLKFHQKSRFFYFSKIKICTCRRGTRACFQCSDFQSKNISYAIFIVKKRPLYVNFSIPPWGKGFFSQCSTVLVGMRVWGHVPNSLRNKNMERHIPYLL
jgi:hypothetical protein